MVPPPYGSDENTIRQARQNRLWIFVVVAVLMHLLLLAVPLDRRQAESSTHGIDVKLSREPSAQAIPIDADVARVAPPTPIPRPQPRPEPEPVTPPVVTETPAPVVSAPAEPAPPSPSITSRLSRYRLEGYTEVPEMEPPTAIPRELGSAPAAPTLAAVLDTTPPELPFADPDTPFVFFSTGLEGGVEKAFYKVTKEFGFKVASAEVKCAWIVVIVACGWK